MKKFRLAAFANKYMFLVVPVFFYFVFLSFFNQFQTGVRHIILVFPLLFIGTGYLFKLLKNAPLKFKILTGAAIVYSMVSVALYYPYIFAYTNEFVGNKKTVYKKIYDSSIDYGQSDSSIHDFLVNNPKYKAASPKPDTGKYAVLMGDMLNTYLRNNSRYKWYLAFEPKGHYRYTVLLFDIKKDDLEQADFSKVDYNIILK